MLGILVFLGSRPSDIASGDKPGVWGGPAVKEEVPATGTLVAVLSAQPVVAGMNQAQFPAPEPNTLELLGVVKGQGSPFGMSGGRGLPITYKVAKGDTLSRIAQRFGVSVQTLISANPGVKTRALQIGQNITVLQTSGILYQSRAGDTLETIAASFKMTPTQIAEFNRPVLTSGKFVPGTPLIIPGVYLKDSGSAYQNKSVSGYFIQPTEGWTSGVLHDKGAVDVAAACGTPVVASAGGLVLDVAEGGWYGGYGSYVYMEHPNGVKTRYAHLASVAVEIGDYVKQGDKIGTVGRTGEATGCHLHFEVDGAPNPLAKQYY